MPARLAQVRSLSSESSTFPLGQHTCTNHTIGRPLSARVPEKFGRRRTYNLLITACVVQEAIATLAAHACLCPALRTILALPAAVPAVSCYRGLTGFELELRDMMFVELQLIDHAER